MTRAALCGAVMLCVAAAAARADRIVLAPSATTLSPKAMRGQVTLVADRSTDSLSWLSLATTEGIEFELERASLVSESGTRWSANVEYPIVPEFNGTPAVSVGVRDFLGAGQEHGAFYAAVTKSLPLSDRQYRIIRGLDLTAGAGTGRLDGPFGGVHLRLVRGIGVNAEVYRRRLNYMAAVPLGLGFRFHAGTLDGTFAAGFSFSLTL